MPAGRMKKSKKQKKGSKKRSKGNDDWEFDGGTASNVNSTNESSRTLNKIRSQEKDERMRRGAFKQAIRRKEKESIAKMATKIKFQDLIVDEAIPSSRETEQPQKKKKPNIVNPQSPFERLLTFVDTNRRDLILSGLVEDPDSKIESQLVPNADEGSIESTVLTGHDNSDTIEYSLVPHEWFFDDHKDNCLSENQAKLRLLKGLCKNDAYKLFGNLHQSLSQTYVADICERSPSFVQIPKLPKLWSSAGRNHSSLPWCIGGSVLGRSILPYLVTYADSFLEVSRTDDGEIINSEADVLEAALFHTAAHVVRSRILVVKNNKKIKALAKKRSVRVAKSSIPAVVAKKVQDDLEERGDRCSDDSESVDSLKDDDKAADESYLDQGFTRPRVLILCPFRGTAKAIIEKLVDLMGPNTSVAGLERLEEEFSAPEVSDEDDTTDTLDAGEKKKKAAHSREKAVRPLDWTALFDQNVDDDFKIGIQVNPGRGKGQGDEKGVYLRLFSDFFISDIVIASPMGLRILLSAENGQANLADSLSSVEIVLIHQADVLYMQNWEHVQFVLDHTNRMPATTHPDTDFSRVRPYFLDDNAKRHRQLILSSTFVDPEIQALFRSESHSKAGLLKLKKEVTKDGSLGDVMVSGLRQVFQLVPAATSLETEDDARFAYFRDVILSPLLRLSQQRTLIVTPSYLHYVRASAVFVCEYSRESEISRGRSRFFHGQKDIMLYSGRFHFFRRLRLRGVQHVVFYSLPQYAQFYAELVNMIGDFPRQTKVQQTPEGAKVSTAEEGGSSNSHSNRSNSSSGMVSNSKDIVEDEPSCVVLFSKFERLALERVLGKKRSDHIFASINSTFMFC